MVVSPHSPSCFSPTILLYCPIMNIKQIYQLALEMGAKADPRGRKGVQRTLDQQKKKHQNLPKNEKELFDKEKLKNPYSDTRVLFGDETKKIKTIFAGIDIDSAEILLARELSKTRPIDMVLSHHPLGQALANLDEVMHLQADLLYEICAVPINIAEGVLKERIAQVRRQIAPINHQQTVDAARLLNIPLMCAHTPIDNLVYQFVAKLIERKKPDTIGEIIDLLLNIPEYKKAAGLSAGPTIFAGERDNRAGKIVLSEMTGGTNANKEIYEKMAQAGVGTIVSMHMADEHRLEARKYHLNVVVAGHIASDSLGMNLFLDELEKAGIKVIPCSGLIRIKRKK